MPIMGKKRTSEGHHQGKLHAILFLASKFDHNAQENNRKMYVLCTSTYTHMHWFAVYHINISGFFNTWGCNRFSLDRQSRGR